ncbi:cobalt-precorrin 5A hydrolase [Cribrihabitans marinus]|uniref:Cobalt-precorrin 5A hydrolase n=1 Tax=Cribrihabitans marinus TaxID=1227549 RepID=A0A1H7B0N2_9RHOB|nr:cobalamin biosynthesis protein [Cribrihabitans marinus]GGH32907.1 hypothetical protein GCM10010973_24680 [Cribrihabitans marinus]SEJ71068.1 cobalt-precorrin 5A hydrolase [Cribrihabitans marinus]
MIVAGFGFSTAATAASLRDAFDAAVTDQRVSALATAEDKTGHPPLVALAQELGLPLRGVEAEALAAAETLTDSRRSTSERGTGSVAEAAALAAAGPDARLAAPRKISTDRLATCAVAIGGQT